MKKRLIVLIISMLLLSNIIADDGSYSQNYGKIKRLYFHSAGVYLSLEGGVTDMVTIRGATYYYLEKTHDNYNALVALLLLASSIDQVVKLRTDPDPVNSKAIIEYVVVDK